MEDVERPFGRFALKIDDVVAFTVPGEEGELSGIVSEFFAEDEEGAPALIAYLPGFPTGISIAVRPEQVTAKILYSNTGLSRFEIAEKVEYYDEDARRVLVGWVYEIDSANREIIIKARGKTFARFPEELRIVPPPRLCERQGARMEHEAEGRMFSEPAGEKRSEEQAGRDREEEKR